jgi:hypothetical protein
LDVRSITGGSSTNPNPGAVANYVAKYATKSVDGTGVFDRRFR